MDRLSSSSNQGQQPNKRGRKRKLVTDSYGCVEEEFNPDVSLDDEYTKIRQIICNDENTDAKHLMKKYPLFFNYDNFINHFKRLTGTSEENFVENFAAEMEALIMYLHTCQKRKAIQNLLIKYGVKQLPNFLQMAELLCAYFKENFSLIKNNNFNEQQMVFTPIIVKKGKVKTLLLVFNVISNCTFIDAEEIITEIFVDAIKYTKTKRIILLKH